MEFIVNFIKSEAFLAIIGGINLVLIILFLNCIAKKWNTRKDNRRLCDI